MFRWRPAHPVVAHGFSGRSSGLIVFLNSTGSIIWPIRPEDLPEKPWATTGCAGRQRNIVNSLYLDPEQLEKHNWDLHAKYQAMGCEVRHETTNTEGGCDVLIVAYGTVARIAKTAIDQAREKGLKIGLFRPITLFPYPAEALAKAAEGAKAVLVAELSTGQMLEDVKAVIGSRRPVAFHGRVGGMVMGPDDLVVEAEKLVGVPA